MTEVTPDQPDQSVTLVLDPSLAHRAPLAAAARLASARNAELVVVVVQNQDFDHLAALPFARELRTSSSSWTGFDRAAALAGHGGLLRRVDRLLSEVARQHQVASRLLHRPGRFRQVARQIVERGNLVLIDRPPLVPVDQRRRYRQIVVVYDGSDACLRTAVALAGEYNSLLQVLVVADDADGFAARRAAAREVLGPLAQAAQWRWQVLSGGASQACAQLLARLAHETRSVQSLVVLPAAMTGCPGVGELAGLNATTVVLEPAVS